MVKSTLCYFNSAHLQISEVSFIPSSRGVFLLPPPLRRSQKQGRIKPEPRQKRWPCALMTSSPVEKQRDLFIWQKQKESGPFIGDLTVPPELCGGGGGHNQRHPTRQLEPSDAFDVGRAARPRRLAI